MTTRRDIIKAGAGIAAILASGRAPAYLVKSMLAERNIKDIVEDERLPYDAEVEWIGQSTNEQYLLTGVIIPQGCILRCEFQFTDMSQSNALCILGTGYNGFGFGISGGSFKIDCFAYLTLQNSKDSNWHTWVIDEPNYKAKLDDTEVSISRWHSDYSGDWSGSGGYPLFRRTRTADGGSDFKTNQARCKSLYIGTSNKALFDGIPVRVGTTGYMYDRVSGELFGNSGIGDFLYGNDI